jgi:hypothetical protein
LDGDCVYVSVEGWTHTSPPQTTTDTKHQTNQPTMTSPPSPTPTTIPTPTPTKQTNINNDNDNGNNISRLRHGRRRAGGRAGGPEPDAEPLRLSGAGARPDLLLQGACVVGGFVWVGFGWVLGRVCGSVLTDGGASCGEQQAMAGGGVRSMTTTNSTTTSLRYDIRFRCTMQVVAESACGRGIAAYSEPIILGACVCHKRLIRIRPKGWMNRYRDRYRDRWVGKRRDEWVMLS